MLNRIKFFFLKRKVLKKLNQRISNRFYGKTSYEYAYNIVKRSSYHNIVEILKLDSALKDIKKIVIAITIKWW